MPGNSKRITQVLSTSFTCSDRIWNWPERSIGSEVEIQRARCLSFWAAIEYQSSLSWVPAICTASQETQKHTLVGDVLIMTGSSIYPCAVESSTSLGRSRSCRREAVNGFVLLKPDTMWKLPPRPPPTSAHRPHSSSIPGMGRQVQGVVWTHTYSSGASFWSKPEQHPDT